MLNRRCPACSSARVRRSLTRRNASTRAFGMRSWYRCRECGTRFSGVSRQAIVLLATALIGGVAAAAAGLTVYALNSARETTERAVVQAQFEQLLDRAKREDPDAELEVYRSYLHGQTVSPTANEAKTWLRRSAQHGNVEAQYELALMLRDGRGALQDYAQAFLWMGRAAGQGHPLARYGLGLMYRDGIGTPPDPVQSYIHLNIAAAQGIDAAAPARDSMMAKLTPEQLSAAQTEARLIAETNR